MKNSIELVNIPTNSLTLVDKSTDVMSCQIRRFNNGIIKLTGFAIVQFLEGAELEAKDGLYTAINVKSVQLILRLAKCISMLQSKEDAIIEVDYKDLQNLRTWLEFRMQHCERERDKRTVAPWGDGTQLKFNPDTYIGQKLLLLDLRELLIGEIVE